MFKIKCALFIGLFALLLDFTWGKAGVGAPTYPNSGGLSGSGQNRSRLSGTGSKSSGGHYYPPAVSHHSYPVSTSVQANSLYPGSHNYSSSGSNQRYNKTSGQKHSYPPSSSVRTNSSYPGGQSSASRQRYNKTALSPNKPASRSRHTYPSTTPRYVYPLPNKSRNTTQRHTYPSTTPRYVYPSPNKSRNTTQRHTYPSTTPKYVYPSPNKSRNTTQRHTYPSTTVRIPSSRRKPNSHSSSQNKITHHTSSNSFDNGNYYYKPPKHIIHNPRHGGPSIKYPVYRGELPSYVYQYRGSRSRYRKLLAGLALMNLGSLSAASNAAHQSSNNHKSSSYTQQPGEICKLVIRRDNKYYEETLIDCQIISSFILEGMQLRDSQNVSTITKQTVTVSSNPPTMLSNGTLIDVVNGTAMPQYTVPASEPGPSISYDMLPNGTLVLKGSLADHFGAANGPIVSSRLTSTEVKNALYVKGEPVEVNTRMECFVIMIRPTWNMRKTLPCKLMEIYADSSLHNSAATKVPALLAIFAIIVAYSVAY